MEFYRTPSAEAKEGWELREKAAMANRQTAQDGSNLWAIPYQRTPWVMVCSMQELGDEYGGAEARKNHILFAGESTAKSYYMLQNPDVVSSRNEFANIYDNKLNRPMPGIIDAKIEYNGAMGATRKANINFKVWTDEQMEVYELLYLVPGAGVRVEWGWSHAPNGDEVIPIGSSVFDNGIFHEESEKLVRKYRGHYGGVQGLVSNFSWTRAADGSYDCTIDVTTIGNAYLQSSIKSKRKGVTQTSYIPTGDEVEDETRYDGVMADMMGAWQTAWKQNMLPEIEIPSKQPMVQGKFPGKDLVGVYIQGSSMDSPRYVTLQYILTYMLNANIGDVIVNPAPTDGYARADEPSVRLASKVDDLNPIYATYRPNMLSCDPETFITPGLIELYNLDGKGMEVICHGSPFGSSSGFYSLFTSNNAYAAFKKLAILPMDERKSIDIRWTLINLLYIKKVFDENDSMDEFLSKILSDLSAAHGSIWNFSLITEEGLVKIIEAQTVSPGIPVALPINMTYKGTESTIDAGSVIRSFTMESDLSSKFAGAVIYGSNNGDGDSEGGQDAHSGEKGDEQTTGYRLYAAKSKNLTIGGDGKTTAPLPTEADGVDVWAIVERMKAGGKTDAEIQAVVNKAKKTPADTLTRVVSNVYAPSIFRDSNAIRNAMTNMNEYLLWDGPNDRNKGTTKVGKSGVGDRPLLAIKLNFECDGFTAFNTGDMLAPTFLPKRFAKYLEYMYLKGDHTINSTDFSTAVECICRPRFDDGKLPVPYVASTSNQAGVGSGGDKIYTVWDDGRTTADFDTTALPPIITMQLMNLPVNMRIVAVAQNEAKNKVQRDAKGETKYGKWINQATAEWCGAFTMWCAKTAGIIMPSVIWVPSGVEAFRKANRFIPVTKNPSPGDIVFFNWEAYNSDDAYASSRADHVGIVESYNASTGVVNTIEGNTTVAGINGVHKFPRNKGVILGYGRPLSYGAMPA